MNREELRHCFQLNYQLTVNDDVWSVSKIDSYAVINDRQPRLSGNCETLFDQFVGEKLLIRFFQQAATDLPVYSHRAGDDAMSEFIIFYVLSRGTYPVLHRPNQKHPLATRPINPAPQSAFYPNLFPAQSVLPRSPR